MRTTVPERFSPSDERDRGLRRLVWCVQALLIAVTLLPAGASWVMLLERREAERRAAPALVETADKRYLRATLGVFLGSAAGVLSASVAASSLLRRLPSVRREAKAREQRFLAQAAHELRTPIAVLRALAEQALMSDREGSEYRRILTEIADEARRASALVGDLLEVARIDSGAVVVGAEEFGAASIAEEAVRTQIPRWPHASITLRVEGDATLSGSRELLLRALTNLVVNAVKHGGAKVHVEVWCRKDGSQVLLEVDDDGPGIPPGEIPRVLGRFERGTNAKGSGTGLGLPIAEGLAKAHGGGLEILTSPAGGCRALLRLPGRRAPVS